MPSFRPRSIARSTLFRHALLGAAALGLSGCLSGQDGFYGNGGDAPDVAVMKRLMAGIGAIDPKAEPIEYKPRAPLAVPPSTSDLPDPEANVAEGENLPANWPRDKDAELLALQASRDASAGSNSSRLTPEQMKEGLHPGISGPSQEELLRRREEQKRLDKNPRLTPTELRTLKLNRPEETALFDAEGKPVRKYLTEPPVEYSTPAPTAPLVVPEKEPEEPYRGTTSEDRGPRG